MTANPYDHSDFAGKYAFAQANTTRNRYEWSVTQPALHQFLDEDVASVVDYGCGAGVFTADLAYTGRTVNAGMECVGTDASKEILRYAKVLGEHSKDVSFQQWDACKEGSSLQNGQADRVFAKLVFNYISNQDLAQKVLPRLRECLNDQGLLVGVLPNSVREVQYSNSRYHTTDTLAVEVGNFGRQAVATTHHHTINDLFTAASAAGFAFGNVFGLPAVRFEPYRRHRWEAAKLMRIADPMPLDPYVNTAKRWVYVFGATEKAEEAFDETTTRLTAWLGHYFPEVADVVDMVTPVENYSADELVPTNKQSAMYIYHDSQHPTNRLLCEESSVEHLSPSQKIALVKRLGSLGIRPVSKVSDHLVET